MRQRRNAVGGVTIVVLVLLAGCGSESTPATSTTTTTTLPGPTSEASDTTAAIEAEVGPQPLPSGGFLDPGVEYVTTRFEPTAVGYRLERSLLLRAFQNPRSTGLENVNNGAICNMETSDYRGVAVHGLWHGLTTQEILEEIDEFEQIELGTTTEAEVAGHPARRVEVVVSNRTSLWDLASGSAEGANWCVEGGQPLDIIVVETAAGTLFITVTAPQDEWDDFYPIAEEILAGISFPDLD